jgi:hypothetical protein
VAAGDPTTASSIRYRLVVAITGLSLAHHVDHIIRGVTGWPLEKGFNPFSASLFVYPVIAAGVILTRRGQAGPRFWALLAGVGAVFILAVHVGPAAGDTVGKIPDQYASPLAGVAALVVLAAFLLALVAHFVHELRLLRG